MTIYQTIQYSGVGLVSRTRASDKLFELGVRMPGVYFLAYGMPGYQFLAFAYTNFIKPSDFQHNF